MRVLRYLGKYMQRSLKIRSQQAKRLDGELTLTCVPPWLFRTKLYNVFLAIVIRQEPAIIKVPSRIGMSELVRQCGV